MDKLYQKAEISEFKKIVCLCVFTCSFVLAFTMFMGGADITEAGDSIPEKQDYIISSESCSAIRELTVNLDTLRRHMGVKKPEELHIQVNQVAPYDVYFQALTQFEKINRLSFEVTRVYGEPLILPESESLSSQMFILLKRTQDLLHFIMDDLGIQYTQIEKDNVVEKVPSDIFKMIMSTNRQVNLLLERQFSPSDVYTRIMQAIGYASHLLNQFPDTVRIPDTPPYESEKKPVDVYFSLLDCLDIISSIYQLNDLNVLEINTTEIITNAITPSDVFDIASLAVARLDFLTKKTGTFIKIREIYYPGRKYPSDVYQYVGILKKQLHLIKQNSQK